MNEPSLKIEVENKFPELKITNPMEIIKKNQLDEKKESIFYQKFFKYLLSAEPMGTKAIDFYNAIEKVSELLQHYIEYFPIIEFGFIKDYLLMDHVPISIYIDYFKCSTFEPNPRHVIQQFILKYQYFPMESIYTDMNLSNESKFSQLLKLFHYLANERQLVKARNLTLEDYSIIRARFELSSVLFEKHVQDYNFKKRLLYIKDKDHEPTEILPRKRQRVTKMSNNTLIHNYMNTSFFISKLRPWYTFDSMLIKLCEPGDSSFYEKEIKKGWFLPSALFYEQYGREGSRQEKNIFYTSENVGFQICYENSGKWYLQETRIFALEKSWKRHFKITKLDCLKRVLMKNMFNYEKIENDLKKALLMCLGDVLDTNVNLSQVYSLLGLSNSSSSIYDYFQRFYHLYGRIKKREPFGMLHYSLCFKLNECFLSWERVLDAPVDILFPEYFMYTMEEQQHLDTMWTNSFHNFMISCLSRSFKDYHLLLPNLTPVSLDSFKTHSGLLYHIYYDNELIDLHDLDLEENPNVFFDCDMVPTGKKGIGKLCEAPVYWNVKSSVCREMEHVSKEELMVTELTEVDLEELIGKMESGNVDETMFQVEEEEIQVLEEEPIEERDHDDDLEYGLEEADIDLDEFYGEA